MAWRWAALQQLLVVVDKERSPQDRLALLPLVMLDRSPLAIAGLVSAQPLLRLWSQAGPAQAHAGHPDGTGTAETCQQHPGSTVVFVPLSLIKPVSGKDPSQDVAWPG